MCCLASIRARSPRAVVLADDAFPLVTRGFANGRYDAFIVWAEKRDDALALECTIVAGAHRGEVVRVVARALHVDDELALVGLPCTLVVEGAEIRVALD